MKTSCSSWSHHRVIKAGQLDQLRWLRECAACAFDGVELLAHHFPRTDRDYLITLKHTCAELFLDIAMVSADGHLTTSDDAQRATDVQKIRHWTEIAEFLGAPCVRFFCGAGDQLAGGHRVYRVRFHLIAGEEEENEE